MVFYSRKKQFLLLVLLVLSFCPSSSQADDRRHGTVLGLVLGKASGDVTLSQNSLSTAAGWSRGGKLMRGRVGHAMTPNLVLSFQYGVWRRIAESDSLGSTDTSDTSSGNEDRYLGMAVFSAELYPHLGGFFIKGGMGYGRLAATIVGESGILTADAFGPLVMMGFGYEFFTDTDISLVAQVDFGRIETTGDISGSFAQFSIGANMYFSAWPF